MSAKPTAPCGCDTTGILPPSLHVIEGHRDPGNATWSLALTDTEQPPTEPTTAAQAIVQAAREAAAEYIPVRWIGRPDLASSYWEGYRAAVHAIVDLLDEPRLLDLYPALGTPLTPTPAQEG